jgi:hypothetical protein
MLSGMLLPPSGSVPSALNCLSLAMLFAFLPASLSPVRGLERIPEAKQAAQPGLTWARTAIRPIAR